MRSFSHTILIGVTLTLGGGVLAAEVPTVDLTHWTAPDIAMAGDRWGSSSNMAVHLSRIQQTRSARPPPIRRSASPVKISIARVAIFKPAQRPTPCPSSEFGGNSRSIEGERARL